MNEKAASALEAGLPMALSASIKDVHAPSEPGAPGKCALATLPVPTPALPHMAAGGEVSSASASPANGSGSGDSAPLAHAQ